MKKIIKQDLVILLSLIAAYHPEARESIERASQALDCQTTREYLLLLRRGQCRVCRFEDAFQRDSPDNLFWLDTPSGDELALHLHITRNARHSPEGSAVVLDYVIRVFDLVDLAHSDRFNPFRYIRKDTDVLRLVDNLIKNTTPKNAQQNDPFWEKSEIALDSAIFFYLLYEAPPEEQTMEMVMYMLNHAGAREDSDDYQSPLDLLFEALEEEQPDHIAVKQYKIYAQAPGKTRMSIIISAAVRLAAFNISSVAGVTAEDDMELGKLGERKQAIFCVVPDSNDNSLNYLVGMLYTCAFQELYYSADRLHGGRLPVPVRLIMDEFANVSLPDGYARLQSTMRSRIRLSPQPCTVH